MMGWLPLLLWISEKHSLFKVFNDIHGIDLFGIVISKRFDVYSALQNLNCCNFRYFLRTRVVTGKIGMVHNLDTFTDQLTFNNIETITTEIEKLLCELGKGRVDGVAYDTAWVGRLAPHYLGHGFENSLEWLRQNQYEDGTWGAPLVHYHDRFISTLAAIVALQESGRELRDHRRIKRGEAALWKLIGKLGWDNHDTVGFPILSASLADEATKLGLDVPHPPIRFGERYRQKVTALLSQTNRDWRGTSLSFSLEAMRNFVNPGDIVLEPNNSVHVSPSATAGYLLLDDNNLALSYLKSVIERDPSGVVPALSPINTFEIAWSLNFLRRNNAVSKDNFQAKRALEILNAAWTKDVGLTYSSYVSVSNIDDTAAAYTALNWGDYQVSPSVFSFYEMEDHFCCFRGETDQSVGAHVRLLMALRISATDLQCRSWIEKSLYALQKLDANGSFWSDKWHTSPYYVTSAALLALQGVADDLTQARLKWMLKTQNDDGGWGYLGTSTPEETAYCLEALLFWHRTMERIDTIILSAAAKYLVSHIHDKHYAPLWIGKSLYTPHNVVKAAILSALFSYYC